jgi:hypothetical protein
MHRQEREVDLAHQTLPVALPRLNSTTAGSPLTMGVLMASSLIMSVSEFRA